MLNGDIYIAERTMEMHVARELRQAETSRLSSRPAPGYARPLMARGGRLLRGAGQFLVALSMSLEGSGAH
jgi:hypothetical protein